MCNFLETASKMDNASLDRLKQTISNRVNKLSDDLTFFTEIIRTIDSVLQSRTSET